MAAHLSSHVALSSKAQLITITRQVVGYFAHILSDEAFEGGTLSNALRPGASARALALHLQEVSARRVPPRIPTLPNAHPCTLEL
jgi:hypothetical protein